MKRRNFFQLVTALAVAPFVKEASSVKATEAQPLTVVHMHINGSVNSEADFTDAVVRAIGNAQRRGIGS